MLFSQKVPTYKIKVPNTSIASMIDYDWLEANVR